MPSTFGQGHPSGAVGTTAQRKGRSRIAQEGPMKEVVDKCSSFEHTTVLARKPVEFV